MHSVDYVVLCCCDFNGHEAWCIDEFDSAHRGYGMGQGKLEE